MELLLSEVTNDRIAITGVSDIPEALREIVGTGEVKEAAHITPDELDKLDKAITEGLAGGERHLDYVKFAYPIIIERTQVTKRASAGGVTVHHPLHGDLINLLDALADPDLTKRADAASDFMSGGTQGKGSDLLDAMQAGKIDGQGMFGFTMPIKLEFANNAVRDTFLEWDKRAQARKKKKSQVKAAALVGAIKRVYIDKVKEMAEKLGK